MAASLRRAISSQLLGWGPLMGESELPASGGLEGVLAVTGRQGGDRLRPLQL